MKTPSLAQHTPWKITPTDGVSIFMDTWGNFLEISNEKGSVAKVYNKADAAYIVRAVNSHEELLDIAELVAELECVLPDSCLHCDAVKAIAKAEGK